jgi:pseudomonalisin
MSVSGRPASVCRRTAVGSAVVAVLSAALAGTPARPVAAASAASPLGAVTGVLGLLPALVRDAVDLGPLPSRPLDVTMALPLRDEAGLHALISAEYTPGSPQYHHFLTPAQFAARFAPDPATVSQVTGWAATAGLDGITVSPNRTLVRMQGPSDVIAGLLGTHLESFLGGDGTGFFSPAAPATLPDALAGRVSAVLGLSDLSRLVTGATPAGVTAAAQPFQGYRPQDFWSFYQAPAPTPAAVPAHRADGVGQTLAIIAAGDLAQPRRDLVDFENRFGLPHVPWTTVPVGPPSTDTSGSPEWDLDTQYSTAFAPAVADLLVYDAPSLQDQDVVAALDRWVTDDRAAQASFSAGECESLAHLSGLETAADTVLEQAVAQGQTLFASSGDTGSFCPFLVSQNGLPLGLPGPSYPSASPDAVSVGGTSLTPDGRGGAHEVAWLAGGGGPALFEPAPAWQANAGGSYLPISRGTPDVSLDADPQSGYAVIVAGQQKAIGGTSASSPSWLGIWTRLQSAHGGRLGFADPTLYALPASAFHDITEGFQGLFLATPGWDYTTGRGTPDISALVAAAGGAAPAAARGASSAPAGPAAPVAPPVLLAPATLDPGDPALQALTGLLLGTGAAGGPSTGLAVPGAPGI